MVGAVISGSSTRKTLILIELNVFSKFSDVSCDVTSFLTITIPPRGFEKRTKFLPVSSTYISQIKSMQLVLLGLPEELISIQSR